MKERRGRTLLRGGDYERGRNVSRANCAIPILDNKDEIYER